MGICPMCNQEDESLVHMARDCVEVSQVWLLLADRGLPNNDFFSLDLHSWLLNNLKAKNLQFGIEWNVIFGAAVSCFWQVRNDKVFNLKDFSAREIHIRIMLQARAFH